MKRFIAVLLLLLVLCLSGCDEMLSQRKADRDMVENFLFLLGNDIGEAKTLLHPNFYEESGEFDTFIEDFESKYNVDFSKGISIYGISGISSGNVEYLDGDYSYTYSEFSYSIVIGTKSFSVYIQTITDEYGSGIYRFEKLNNQMDD